MVRDLSFNGNLLAVFGGKMMNNFEPDLSNFQNVKWLDYTQNLMDTQKEIFQTNELTDVLIAIGPNRFKAHQLVLSASSDFLKDVLTASDSNHQQMPIIVIPDLNPQLVEPLLEFMYTGEAFVNTNILSEFLEACSFLRIRGFISYDCLVNGIRLQQDPSHAIAAQLSDETEIDNKKSFVLPQTFDDIVHDDVVVDGVEYSIKPVDVEDEEIKTSETQNCPEQILGDVPIEEYLEEEDEMIIGQTETLVQTQTEDIPLVGGDLAAISTISSRSKSYTEATLVQAINELRAGASVVDVAAKYEIPRSTIYSKLRHSKDPVYRKYRSSHLEDAARAVTEQGVSLKDASQQFDVSKTVLWRTLKKTSNYKPEERFQSLRTEAVEAIQTGETLISISRRFNIPLATLHRDKVRLHSEGKLPENCKLTRRDSSTSYQKRLQAAIRSCRIGMPQKTASELYKVPKTTIWRHLQRANQTEGETEPDAAEELDDPLEDEEKGDVVTESFEFLSSFDEEVDNIDYKEDDDV